MKKALSQCVVSVFSSLLCTAGFAAPDAYSINSDGPNAAITDSLYRIDLATGQHVRLGYVQSLGQIRRDVEGLAFAPDGTLYGLDDEAMKLLPINTDNGTVLSQAEFNLSGMGPPGENDFGMTFACDGSLYATSSSSNSLYRVALNGTATRIGALGSLGREIVALAAFGSSPVELYGLGLGGLEAGAVNQGRLYSINPADGTALEIGQLGPTAAAYNEAGLAFDSSGQLWAITDRSAIVGGAQPSQLLQINIANGAATLISSTAESGFESLAITVPRGCSTGSGELAKFTVQKRYVDDNNITPTTLMLTCNTGLPLDQTIVVQPNNGVYGDFEVEFVVEQFDSGELDCTVTETPPPGYSPSYTCLGESDCTAAQSQQSCTFVDVLAGSENLCQVQNYPNPVSLTIHKQWTFESGEQGINDTARIDLSCSNVFDGDGDIDGSSMNWSWPVDGNATLVASLSPAFDGTTNCSAVETTQFSAIESDNGCAGPINVKINDAPIACTITNTVFLEGIPTLSDYGRMLLILLVLGAGFIAVRRF